MRLEFGWLTPRAPQTPPWTRSAQRAPQATANQARRGGARTTEGGPRPVAYPAVATAYTASAPATEHAFRDVTSS